MNALKRELTWTVKRELTRRTASLQKGATRMDPSFLQRTAPLAVAGALTLAIVWAVTTLGPTAINRWF